MVSGQTHEIKNISMPNQAQMVQCPKVTRNWSEEYLLRANATSKRISRCMCAPRFRADKGLEIIKAQAASCIHRVHVPSSPDQKLCTKGILIMSNLTTISSET